MAETHPRPEGAVPEEIVGAPEEAASQPPQPQPQVQTAPEPQAEPEVQAEPEPQGEDYTKLLEGSLDPKLLDEYRKTSKGRITLTEALSTAALAFANPEMAQSLIRQRADEKQDARKTLAQLQQQAFQFRTAERRAAHQEEYQNRRLEQYDEERRRREQTEIYSAEMQRRRELEKRGYKYDPADPPPVWGTFKSPEGEIDAYKWLRASEDWHTKQQPRLMAHQRTQAQWSTSNTIFENTLKMAQAGGGNADYAKVYETGLRMAEDPNNPGTPLYTEAEIQEKTASFAPVFQDIAREKTQHRQAQTALLRMKSEALWGPAQQLKEEMARQKMALTQGEFSLDVLQSYRDNAEMALSTAEAHGDYINELDKKIGAAQRRAAEGDPIAGEEIRALFAERNERSGLLQSYLYQADVANNVMRGYRDLLSAYDQAPVIFNAVYQDKLATYIKGKKGDPAEAAVEYLFAITGKGPDPHGARAQFLTEAAATGVMLFADPKMGPYIVRTMEDYVHRSALQSLAAYEGMMQQRPELLERYEALKQMNPDLVAAPHEEIGFGKAGAAAVAPELKKLQETPGYPGKSLGETPNDAKLRWLKKKFGMSPMTTQDEP